MDRRTLLQATALSAQRAAGASERFRFGLIGCGARGRYVARFLRELPNVECAATADVYLPHAHAAREWAGPQAQAFQDFRRLLELSDLDAVVVATPDHWHATAAVLACQAGKHVYVEKPFAYGVREGRAIVEAARRYGRVVQPGTQHRSAPHFAECAAMVRAGKLGDIRFVRVWNYVNLSPDGIGTAPDGPPPAGLDWEFYLGPAPRVPFNPKRFLATYRWFSDYSGGYITDYGTHRFDTVHQIMGVNAPRTVAAAGGRFTLRGAGDVPDTLQVTYEYPGFILSYECSNLNGFGIGVRSPGMKYYNSRGEADRPNGMAFYGTNGTLFADRIGYEIFPEFDSRAWFAAGAPATPPKPRMERLAKNTTDATALHAKRFVENVRAGRRSLEETEAGHHATVVAHLGNIALRVGRKLRWDAAAETFPEDAGARRWLARTPRKPWDLIPF